MSIHNCLAFAASLALWAGAAVAADTPGLGKPISETDLALWDISIPPDGAGLPPGSGTSAQGAAVYAQKCEVCHGKDGHGGRNSMLGNPPGKSDRTMATYVPNATTIFDFTPPAMPWRWPRATLASARGACRSAGWEEGMFVLVEP